MRLVLLIHPSAFQTASMPRFAEMIRRGMTERGHQVELWTSRPQLSRLPVRSQFFRKWLGYADQFLFYPGELRRRVKQQPHDTLFVVTDQALGMWVPCLARRPHVIHCHDFLALRSALGEFPENPTGWTGRQYQRLIRKGFSQGGAFISVSEKSRSDLHRFLPRVPKISEVVHNGLNHPFRRMDFTESDSLLKTAGVEIPERGYLLHVGGNQWYKNRKGVLAIYRAYAERQSEPVALCLIGVLPTSELLQMAASIPHPGKVCFWPGLDNQQVNAAYSRAVALLFPSLEEGFGWPIVEAMASGCPVITTDAAPMVEVAGGAARLIPRMPAGEPEQRLWAATAARVLSEVASLNKNNRADLLNRGQANARRFDTELALSAYETVYQKVLTESGNPES